MLVNTAPLHRAPSQGLILLLLFMVLIHELLVELVVWKPERKWKFVSGEIILISLQAY